MLKKIAHFVLALLLLVSTTGMTISMHYCSGELVSISINKEAKSCCDGGNGCCENKTLHLEIEDDYVSPMVVADNTVVELEVLFPILFVYYVELLPAEDQATIAFYDSSSPPKTQNSLSLLQAYLC